MQKSVAAQGTAQTDNSMHGSAPSIGPSEIAGLIQLARTEGGISLTDDKGEFLRLRLGRLLREADCASFTEYLAQLRRPDATELRRRFVEALTTHTTSFFRERRHYDFMQDCAVPALMAEGVGAKRPLQIWSAACSTGAEIWSAAMLLETTSMPDGRALDWRGMGTDLSERILRRATNAVYIEEETIGIPPELARRFLLRRLPRTPQEPSLFRIVPELRERTRFLKANLLALDSGPNIAADIAFLRNVLIYFEPADRQKVARDVAARVRPGGYLFTGHAESLGNTVPTLRQEAASIYRRI
ncbi:MAG: CheR family methyltransferase [Pseudomonadota bacterium]